VVTPSVVPHYEEPIKNEVEDVVVQPKETQVKQEKAEPETPKRRYDFNNLLGKIKEFLDNAE
jgi:cell division protein FtsA